MKLSLLFLKINNMNDLQKSLNPLIDELIPIQRFIEAGETQQLVKNCFDIKCPKCGSDNINEQEMQTRSADEASTKVFICLSCFYRFRKN